MSTGYDAIVVGARCAGSPTAMLLARKGHRVLMVDRATSPSDTMSTHAIHPLGVAALSRWGLLDRLVATGCPPIHTYNKDPITAQGIQDAFCDAERCAGALDEAFRGSRPFDEAMAGYQRARDEHAMPMYEFTCLLATLEPPPPETQELFGAVHGNREAMDRFVQMNAGTISPAEFFAPESVGAILAEARDAR